MKEILNILDTLQNIQGAKVSKLLTISSGYLAHTGKFSVTNLGRWTIGLSVRNLERFYASSQDWLLQTLTIVWVFFEQMLKSEAFRGNTWCLAVDETVGKKSGKQTYGLGYHYSSKEDKVIKSISVLNLSLIHITTKLSLPVHQRQLTFDSVGKKTKVRKQPIKAQTPPPAVVEGVIAQKKERGRPKGSKNKPKKGSADSEMAQTFQVFKQLLVTFLALFNKLLGGFMQFSYIVGDSGFGNDTVASICRASGKHLISKLQYNSALYFKAVVPELVQGTPKKKGRKPIYGEKLNYDELNKYDEQYLVEKRPQKDGSIWYIYQFKNMLSKNFDIPLHIVIIVKYDKNGNLCKTTQRIILFCTNNEENYKNIITIYQVRFQIEFNFRDARQHFGLTHFKNIKEKQVTNAIGFAFFMVTLSNIMIAQLKHDNPKLTISIQDLKACFRAKKYLIELINTPDLKQSPFFNQLSLLNFPNIGAINL
jgi:putative transposase